MKPSDPLALVATDALDGTGYAAPNAVGFWDRFWMAMGLGVEMPHAVVWSLPSAHELS